MKLAQAQKGLLPHGGDIGRALLLERMLRQESLGPQIKRNVQRSKALAIIILGFQSQLKRFEDGHHLAFVRQNIVRHPRQHHRLLKPGRGAVVLDEALGARYVVARH